MQHRVFIAAALGDAKLASETAALLRRRGAQTVSSWHETLSETSDAAVADLQVRQAICERNQADLRKADAFVLLFSDACRGALMELADADNAGIKLFVVGSPLSITIMACRKHVRFYEAIEQVVAALTAA